MFISLVPKSPSTRRARRSEIASAPSVVLAGLVTALFIAAVAAAAPTGVPRHVSPERVAPVVLPTVQVVATR